MDKNKNYSIYVLMLLVPLFWGGAFGAAKHVITEIPPMTAAAFRFGVAGIILLIITIARSEFKVRVIKERWVGIILMGISGILVYNAFFFIALKYTSAINGSLIMSSTPVFMTLGAVLFLKEKWSLRLGIGIGISLFGVVTVILKGSIQNLIMLSFNFGDLLFIGALIGWFTHGLLGKVVMKGTSPLLTTTLTTLVGSFFLFICSLFEEGWGQIPHMSIQSWIEMIYMIVFASVLAFLLWNRGIHEIGASKASIFMNFVPIHATWIAILLYGSSITWIQIIGIAMVIIGVCTVTYQGKQKEAEAILPLERELRVGSK